MTNDKFTDVMGADLVRGPTKGPVGKESSKTKPSETKAMPDPLDPLIDAAPDWAKKASDSGD